MRKWGRHKGADKTIIGLPIEKANQLPFYNKAKGTWKKYINYYALYNYALS